MTGEETVAQLQGSRPPATMAQWLDAAAAVLRKAGRLGPDDDPAKAMDKLRRRTLEDLPVPPLGTPQLSADLPPTGDPGAAPFTRGTTVGRSAWDVRSVLTLGDDATVANRLALEELEGGASSLWVRLAGDPAGLAQALHEVRLDLAPVAVQSDDHPVAAARALADLLTPVQDRDPRHQLGGDPVGAQLRGGPVADLAVVVDCARLAQPLGVRAAVVDGTAAHEAGAGDAAELGWTLAVGVAYLRALEEAGIPPEKALPLVEFRYAVTDDQFGSIAKLRAARQLWDRVGELCGVGEGRPGQCQHAVTSRPMMTRYDSYTNLLRTTVAAFAAGVGAADAITVWPFDAALGQPEILGRRLARNISHLLIEESHVAATADPAGGAHAVEALTAELADAAWAEFDRIERAGGAIAALADGSVAGRWQATADRRATLIANRRQPITGVSEFPNAAEQLPAREPSPLPGPAGWADPFEELRDHPTEKPLFLATLGPVAAHTARSTFAANLFGAGGVGFTAAGSTVDPDDVLTAYREAGTPAVVCLAGTDADYLAFAPDLVPALRALGATRILLAGKPAAEITGLIDDHVAVGQDALAFLHRTRDALSGKES